MKAIPCLLAVLCAVFLGGVARAAEIRVDADQQFQTIEGFGTCLVSWNRQMARYYETPAAQEMFAREMGLSILRCNLWGDGTIGPVDDPEKISHKDPAFAQSDPRTPVFIKFAKAIRKINPDVKVIGSVWSPPKWMKMNNAIVGGRSGAISATDYKTKAGETKDRVDPKYYPHFVAWVVEMVKYYEAQGVPMYAVSPANEPQFTQTFESCTWTTQDLITVIKMLRKRLDAEKLGHVKIFAMESMTGFNWPGGPNRTFVSQLKNDPEALRALGAFATHGYVDGFTQDQGQDSAKQFWNLIAEFKKPYWLTEGGTGGHAWPDVISPKGLAAGVHNSLVAGNVSAWVPWQFAENRNTEHNLTAMDGLTKKAHVVRQYARYIAAGSVRIAAEPGYGDVNVSAFVHPKAGGLTIVLTNPSTTDQPVTLTLQGKGLPKTGQLHPIRTSASEDSAELTPIQYRGGKLELTVPAQSVTTLTTTK